MRNYSYINRICLGVLIGMILPSVCGCNQDSDSSPTVQKGILGDGSQTLTMWYVDSYADRNINTVRSVQEMEEYTGIHIEYQVGNYSNMQESYLLMLSSGDIPTWCFMGMDSSILAVAIRRLMMEFIWIWLPMEGILAGRRAQRRGYEKAVCPQGNRAGHGMYL